MPANAASPANHLRQGFGGQEAGRHIEDAALLEGFVSTTLPADQFHHEQHVRVAWMFVGAHGMPAALGEFAAAIKRFAEAKGATGLYHETITWAFLLIIAERKASNPGTSWHSFAAANADLFAWQPSILARYYSDDVLKSDLARRVFVMPDRVRTKYDTGCGVS